MSPSRSMSSMDLAQLSLPRIAQAVADGEVNPEEATAEIRRRPQDPRAPRNYRPRVPPAPRISTDLASAITAVTRELKDASRHLAHLEKRLDAILQQVEHTAQVPTPTRRRRAA